MNQNNKLLQAHKGGQGGGNRYGNSRSGNRSNNQKGGNRSNMPNESPYKYRSTNMNRIYQYEYFDDLKRDKRDNKSSKFVVDEVEKRNRALETFSFDLSQSPLHQLGNAIQKFTLVTTYPGLMMGTGNPHEIKGEGIIKTGFSFDYVTGLPFLNGSSLKGILRAAFPDDKASEEVSSMKTTYLLELFGISEQYLKELEESIFENADVFIGAYPSGMNKKALLELDYITPHDKEGFKNPVPINTIKVKPGVAFEFGFILEDSVLSNGEKVSVAQKLEAFKTILMDVGIGAKTNIGYGQMVEWRKS